MGDRVGDTVETGWGKSAGKVENREKGGGSQGESMKNHCYNAIHQRQNGQGW